MRFKLRQMEVFRAVMLTGSMNGAARLLFVSQPAISRLIAHTEQSLGLQLFERDKGKLTPTPEAQRLFQEVGPLFEEALRIDELARDLAERPAGALTLCSSPSLALNFVPPVIAQYLELYPNVRLKYHTTLLADMAHELLGRKAELAVSVLPIDHPNLVVEPLATGEMVCILPQGHPLASRPAVSLAELARHRLILYSRNIPFGQLVAAAFQRANVSWNSAVDIVRAELACALVRVGAGVAIVDQFSVGEQGWPGVVTRPLQESIPLSLSLVRSRFERPSRQVQRFVRLIKEHARASVPARP
ncbi:MULTISPECIES: LysR family transcriptional regulator [Achromobacter]|jgi:DNA-binding transcriptional LysR family regulator|uniref:LysR family transcriptional regulator n=1 Tax=Achromobacter denitrificans TaxID=32002 RepID=A0A427WQJ4_ACHDE|nr:MULTISPECIES: LysR family transcriptional regulator [Achromobacter]ASC68420.1 LysR family transcriptional regulator [Achromobacter denitrificans]MDF3847804.1 LysR family transcriptional regulator [Achromobacter denitrificans]MDF3857933.1 LysR family transcriptional regulator [Achromobacter denitrificans]QCS66627.1 LysR family transcriptional regulator [Achromobacter denitrificans]QKQ48245.1 LysR family transcriptional regulator [Achromobacter denitrificans]